MPIHCPKCNAHKTYTIETRDQSNLKDDLSVIRRRRQCKTCGFRISTIETLIRDAQASKCYLRDGVVTHCNPQGNEAQA